MCATCGCEKGHTHAHDHDHEHEREREPDRGRVVSLEARVLAKNARLAAENRRWLRERGVAAFNVMSSPGAGKTTLLERTIRELGRPVFVVEGDQATSRDAERIRKAGARAVQVNTGAGCHLDAHMVGHALEELDASRDALVFIENVGNLVCPALFDLGERAKVVVTSVTEGDDKPIKYPHMFRASTLLLINKIDLLPHVSFDVAACVRFAREVNPEVEVIELSATRGDGMGKWCSWLEERAS
jgi:hydrogenase nickel incorporation protein HypB